ncbi:hypothetical protein [Streptomyces sp. NPDC093260]|uniref:hypothetical protein n=1 Tax=Streptomyces sp. NPDC093260 TaxID=3155073 RepID=UPI00342DEDCE
MSTVQPYSAATVWKFVSKRGGYEHTTRLALYWEPDGSAMSDDYLPQEADAQQLWRQWANDYADYYHRKRPDTYRPGQVPIFWFITSVGRGGTFEAAPHQDYPPDFPLREDFLTHMTHPVNANTGEPLNWMRLPVLDRAWNAKQADKGGFIQEATGWKPSPLQPAMNVRQIARAAGIYVPA